MDQRYKLPEVRHISIFRFAQYICVVRRPSFMPTGIWFILSVILSIVNPLQPRDHDKSSVAQYIAVNLTIFKYHPWFMYNLSQEIPELCVVYGSLSN